MSSRKDRKITIRMSLADYILIRDAAFAKGGEMGPLLAEWLKQPLAAARRAAKRKAVRSELRAVG